MISLPHMAMETIRRVIDNSDQKLLSQDFMQNCGARFGVLAVFIFNIVRIEDNNTKLG